MSETLETALSVFCDKCCRFPLERRSQDELDEHCDKCETHISNDALDLINRQQAEIEKIKTSIKLADNYFSEGDFAKGITIVYRLAKWLDR